MKNQKRKRRKMKMRMSQKKRKSLLQMMSSRIKNTLECVVVKLIYIYTSCTVPSSLINEFGGVIRAKSFVTQNGKNSAGARSSSDSELGCSFSTSELSTLDS